MIWRWSFVVPALLAHVVECHAADKPEIGAVPSWVVPTAMATDPNAKSDGTLQILLSDQQVQFHDQTTATYTSYAVRILKPEGLAAMGTIALRWKPNTDRIIFHKVDIIRDGKTTNLARDVQNFTILRRENNLELSMIDGILTATMPIEGLQVGDVVDVAYTVEHTDPLLQGHHDITLDAGSNGSVARLNVAAHWDRHGAMRLRSQNLPAPLRQTADGAVLQADMVEPLTLPQGAPPRFLRGRQIEFSDFRNWGEVAATFTPLFDSARQLAPNSPLLAEIARIKAQSSDPVAQAGAALALVEDNVRYLYVGLNDSNLKPTAADVTWTNRYGDCKAKTVLLVAILEQLGIKAEPALVSVAQGDGLDQRLPNAGQFDHVIVRATIGGKVYWLDATRTGDSSIAALRVPDWHWALPLHAGSDRLEPLVVPVENEPTVVYALTLDASKGITLPAAAEGEMTWRGDAAYGLKLRLDGVAQSQRDLALRAIWSKQYDFITPGEVTASWDQTQRVERLTMRGTARMDWNVTSTPPYYEMDGATIGWRGDYHRDPGPDSSAPFDINYPDYPEYREKVILPGDGWGFTLQGQDIDRTVAQRAMFRKAELNGNVATLVTRQRPLVPELSFAEGQAADQTLRQLAKGLVTINVDTAKVEPTPDEARAILADPPATDEQGYIRRLAALRTLRRYADGLAEADRFAAAYPKSTSALGFRAQFHSLLGHDAAARADASAILAMAPDNPTAKWVLNYYALKDQQTPGGPPFPDILVAARTAMAQTCLRTGDYQCAIIQAGRAIAFQPNLTDLYVIRANAFQRLNRQNEAVAEADSMIRNAPKDADMLTVGGVIYASTGHVDQGMKAFADSIAVKPTVAAYLNRIRFLPAGDQTARKRDIDAALRLDPKNTDALVALANWQHDNGDTAAEIATLQSIPPGPHNDMNLKVRMGTALARSGQVDKAQTAYAEVRGFATGSKDAQLFNALCYSAATANFQLDTALADCQQAIALDPNSFAIRDSLGFVQLRLGRYDDAIASYTRSLAAKPSLVNSLYGRGIAYLRKGNKVAAAADIKAAIAGHADIVAEFARMGITQ